MSDTPTGPTTHPFHAFLTRRRLVGSAAAIAALAPATAVLSRQDASPEATPAASPAASPVATPTPDIFPEHQLRIIEDLQPRYDAEPVGGGTLRLYARRDGLTDFNPTAQRQDIQALFSLYDPLVRPDPVTMEPRPGLATAWGWSADGLSLSFDLRSGVTFHDGTAFTAEDARFSILAYRDDYDTALAGMFALVTDVVAESAERVTVTFAEPDGAFLFNAATQPIFSSRQYITQWESRPVGERSISGFDWAANPPVGTGPWRFGEASDDRLTFVRNDDYWETPPHADELVFIAEDDQAARIDGWKNGDVDVVWPVRATDLDAVWDEEGRLFVAPSPTVFFAAFNVANPANVTPDMMADPALRQALSLAVDRESYAREVFFSFIDETMAGTVVQPWARDESLRNPAFEIDGANRILDEAGWVDVDGDGMREDAVGNKLDLYLIVSSQERPELLAIIERLGDNFQKIGARLTVQQLEPEELDTRWVENRMYDMVAFSLVGYPAFNHYDLYGTAWDIRANTRGWNPGGYSNPDVDAAIDEYFAATSPDDMRNALVRLQQAANDDLFGLWFGSPHDLILVREDVQGFVPNMFLQTIDTRVWWRGEADVTGDSPDAPTRDIPVVFWDPED